MSGLLIAAILNSAEARTRDVPPPLPAVTPITQEALQSEITATRAGLTAKNVVGEDLTTTKTELQPLFDKLHVLFALQAQLDFGRDGGYLNFRFEHNGDQGRFDRSGNDGEWIYIVMGGDNFRFTLANNADRASKVRNDVDVRVNGQEVDLTDPKVMAAVDFAIEGIKKAIANPQFREVASGATMASSTGYVYAEPLAPGTAVATFGLSTDGRVLAYTDENSNGQLETGWVNVRALKPIPTLDVTTTTKDAETFTPYKRFVSPSANSNGGLNLRNAPSGDKAALTGIKIDVDTEVTVVGEDAPDDPLDWVKVTYTKGRTAHEGWVSGDYLVVTKGEVGAAVEAPKFRPYQMTVTSAVGDTGLAVRSAPMSRETEPQRIAQGSYVEVLAEDGDWVKVSGTDISGDAVKGWSATTFAGEIYLIK